MRKDEELSQQLKVMMGKAKDSLEVAKQLHNQNHYNDAASKAYYAVFHSLQVALLTKGLSFSKHSAVMSAFNKEFIYGGVFAKNFYDKIVRLFHDRQIGDYEYEKYINHESSEADVGDAEAIICAIGKDSFSFIKRERLSVQIEKIVSLLKEGEPLPEDYRAILFDTKRELKG